MSSDTRTITGRDRRFITARNLAMFLDLKAGTLKKWRRDGRGPQGWIRVGKTLVLYPWREVESWLAEKSS